VSNPARLLLRALSASAEEAGCTPVLTHAAERSWATATFVGARHIVQATAEAAGLARWLAMLPEADLPMRGWFVASCAAELGGQTATIELLVLEA
jgi:hypothetical protein